MSRTQHAGLAFREVDGTAKGRGRGSRGGKGTGRTGQHLPGRSGRVKGKDDVNLHVKKDLSLAD